MTDQQANDLAALKIHQRAFANSVAAMEANPEKNLTVLGIERANLANLTEQIRVIEAAESAEK